ncbi:MAG: peptide ABC transporter permease [Chloroflexi bacterium RBG_16_72_14]|nr:MAG: peptide ABC transporter permease [Chloroflexi bacterium RBG_16_72_14]
MTRFILRRLAGSALVLLGLSVITFALARVVPSNPAAIYIGPKARPEDIARVTQELGLDRPLPVQYLAYMRDMLTGDWGTSIGTKRPVLAEIIDRLPATLELILTAMLLAVPLGILLGVLSARWQRRPPDLLVRIVSIVGVSIPAFWLGLLLQVVFFRTLGLLPLTGRVDADLRFTSPIVEVTGLYLVDALVSGNWTALRDVAWHLVLPAVTLAAYPIGLIARMTRASMLEAIGQDYVRAARAAGIRESLITYRLALKNALIPVTTVVGLTLAYSLTGTFFVEVVFNWPGLGTFAVKGLLNLDYPVVMGITLFGAFGYVLINLAVDLAQSWLDPRTRLA